MDVRQATELKVVPQANWRKFCEVCNSNDFKKARIMLLQVAD